MAKTRETVWAAVPQGDITIDFDATLLDVHSEKQDAAPNKRGYGFHPLGPGAPRPESRSGRYCVRATLARTTPTTTSSCWTRRSVPSRRSTRFSHQPGDDPGLVRHHILLRADSVGATHDFLSGLAEANIEYSIGHPVDASVREALLLFDTSEGFRHTCLITNANAFEIDVATLEFANAAMPASRTGSAAGRTAGYRTCRSRASPRTLPGLPPVSSPGRCSHGCR